MNDFRSLFILTSLSTALPVLLIYPAHAYLDPGSMGMALQLLVGAIVGGLVALKLFWYRLKTFFSRRDKASKVADRTDVPSQ